MSYKTVAEEFLGDHFMVCENVGIEIPGNCLLKYFELNIYLGSNTRSGLIFLHVPFYNQWLPKLYFDK